MVIKEKKKASKDKLGICSFNKVSQGKLVSEEDEERVCKETLKKEGEQVP